MRTLIINADDLGLTSGVNRAIAQAHEHGVVTSASLMANAPAFSEAVQIAQSAQALGIGCHVVLVDGTPVLDAGQLTSLIPGNKGHFHTSLSVLAACALATRLDSDQIQAEATAQIRRLQSHNIQVSHLDTHKHAHIFPVVLRGLVRAARTCGVPALRNPFEPARSFPAGFIRRRPGLWKRSLEMRALRTFHGPFRKAVSTAGLATTDGTLGIVATGSLDAALLETIIDNMPEGRWELVCHPGYVDEELDRAGTRLCESRAVELQALTSQRVRDILAKRKVKLISYRDLP